MQVGDHAHVIILTGGSSNGIEQVTSTVSEFDVTRVAWRPLAPMNVARSHHCSFVHEGKLFVLGGKTPAPDGKGYDLIDSVEEYDPSTNAWRLLDWGLPFPGSSFVCGYSPVGGGVVTITGGYIGKKNAPETTMVWSRCLSVPGTVRDGWEQMDCYLPENVHHSEARAREKQQAWARLVHCFFFFCRCYVHLFFFFFVWEADNYTQGLSRGTYFRWDSEPFRLTNGSMRSLVHSMMHFHAIRV